MNLQGDIFERHAACELLSALGPGYEIIFTANRRTVVSVNRSKNPVQARVSRMLSMAPKEVIHDLAGFILGKHKTLSATLKRFIHLPSAPLSKKAPKGVKIKTRGKTHDLAAIAMEVGERYFNNELTTCVTWGRPPSALRGRKRRRSIRYGSYDASLDLVTIHPALDSSFVPRMFVEFIVYHEMLHKAIPVTVGDDGTARFHTRPFREAERRFAGYAEMKAWEKANIGRILEVSGAMAAGRR